MWRPRIAAAWLGRSCIRCSRTRTGTGRSDGSPASTASIAVRPPAEPTSATTPVPCRSPGCTIPFQDHVTWEPVVRLGLLDGPVVLGGAARHPRLAEPLGDPPRERRALVERAQRDPERPLDLGRLAPGRRLSAANAWPARQRKRSTDSSGASRSAPPQVGHPYGACLHAHFLRMLDRPRLEGREPALLVHAARALLAHL